jgi:hypothetical protein
MYSFSIFYVKCIYSPGPGLQKKWDQLIPQISLGPGETLIWDQLIIHSLTRVGTGSRGNIMN